MCGDADIFSDFLRLERVDDVSALPSGGLDLREERRERGRAQLERRDALLQVVDLGGEPLVLVAQLLVLLAELEQGRDDARLGDHAGLGRGGPLGDVLHHRDDDDLRRVLGREHEPEGLEAPDHREGPLLAHPQLGAEDSLGGQVRALLGTYRSEAVFVGALCECRQGELDFVLADGGTGDGVGAHGHCLSVVGTHVNVRLYTKTSTMSILISAIIK